MKIKIFLISLIIITSCQKEISQKDKFIAFLKTMPDVKLPFYTNSAEELKVSLYPSSLI